MCNWEKGEGYVSNVLIKVYITYMDGEGAKRALSTITNV